MIRETPGIIIIRIISEPREIINPSQTDDDSLLYVYLEREKLEEEINRFTKINWCDKFSILSRYLEISNGILIKSNVTITLISNYNYQCSQFLLKIHAQRERERE